MKKFKKEVKEKKKQEYLEKVASGEIVETVKVDPVVKAERNKVKIDKLITKKTEAIKNEQVADTAASGPKTLKQLYECITK